MIDSSDALQLLTLIRLDAQRLFERIKFRELEYMHVFSSKRTREHFPRIFKNRYEHISFAELKFCSSDTIIALDEYYHMVDDMSWYLFCTEDMPTTVQENIERYIRDLDQLHQTAQLYLNVEIESRFIPPSEKRTNLKEGEF